MLRLYKFYKPYFTSILLLSYPIIIGQLGFVLMGVADVIMIGKLAPVNLAAAALANAIYFFVGILGIGTLTAVSPLVAKTKAEKDTKGCGIYFDQALIASLILTFFICIFTYLITENLSLLNQEKEVEALAFEYLHALNIGTPFLMLFMALKQFSDGLSITKPSAVITLIALVLNIILNYIFIYGFLACPAFGLLGAGIATTLSRLIMLVMLYVYMIKSKLYNQYIIALKHRLNLSYLLNIFKIGLPSGFQYFFEVGAFAGAAVLIGWLGNKEQAAHQVAINLASITYMISLGLSAGGSIAVGDAYGRKDKTEIQLFGKASLILAVLFMGFAALVFFFFNYPIAISYVSNSEVALLASSLLIIAGLFQLSDGLQCVSLGILRGLHDTSVPTVVTIIAYWLIGLPTGYFMAFNMQMGVHGMWYGLSIGLTFSAVMLTYRFLKLSKRLTVFKTYNEALV